MNTETTSPDESRTASPPPPPTLVRPVAGRAIGGVAAGLAHYLKLPVGLMRFAFLAAVVFGGLGFVLYGMGWLLIRDEVESESIAQRVFDNVGAGPSWIGILLLILAGVIVLDSFTFMPGSLIWAIVLVTVGLLLYRGDLGRRTSEEGQGTDADAISQQTGESDVASGEAPPTPPPGPRPTVPTPPPPATPPPPPSILGRLTIGVGMVALGILAIVDNATSVIDPGLRHYLALATVVLGLGLLTGAFIGRARWMILLGVFLVPSLLASPVTELDWEGEFGRIVAPVELDGLQTSYRSSAGSYHFDLTQVEWQGETVSLEVDLAAGEIVIVLPEDVAMSGSAQVGIGTIEAPDGDRAGLGDISRSFALPGDNGTLDVDLQVGAGVIEVHRGLDPALSPGESWGTGLGPGYVTVTERNR